MDSSKFIDDPYKLPDLKVWFRDSLMIEENTGIFTTNNTASGEDSIYTKLLGYTFFHWPTRMLCYFTDFSDTAKVFDWETLSDTSILKKGGKNFFTENSLPLEKNLTGLSDTIINNRRMSRYKTYNNRNGIKYPLILYYDCSRRIPLLNNFKGLADSIGCLESGVQSKDIFSSVIFLSEKLNEKENKIFDMWENHAFECAKEMQTVKVTANK